MEITWSAAARQAMKPAPVLGYAARFDGVCGKPLCASLGLEV